MGKLTRRRLIFGGLGSAAALAYPCYWEPRWFEVTRRRAILRRVRPEAPVRILHLSDLHASFFVPIRMIDDAVTAGLRENPELICVTGDFISDREEIDRAGYIRTLHRLSQRAPTYAVLGNHDGGRWAAGRLGYPDHTMVDRILEDSGVEVLHNRQVRVRLKNAELTLAGSGDLWAGELDPRGTFAGTDQKLPIVLMAHNPDTKGFVGAHSWDLMLSGHTHGGQIILPFDGPRFAPVQDGRYVEGLKRWGERLIHVTRGVGNLGGVRFRCRPEVSLLTLS